GRKGSSIMENTNELKLVKQLNINNIKQHGEIYFDEVHNEFIVVDPERRDPPLYGFCGTIPNDNAVTTVEYA
ncbi:hypothetical protein M3M33_16465, partial [Loigolactobacillus coryniformis]|uniref:hypothetical protein n=1 Tax=Loigolactobacillus coryniformis TaxID=1610 RepID=UPI00201AAF4F